MIAILIRGVLPCFLLLFLLSCSVNNKNISISNITLESGKWILINLSGQEIIKQNPERPAYLEFNATDEKITGFAGCNRLFGAYNIEGSAITFSRVGSTKMTCPDAPLENAFVTNLQRINRYQIEGEKLLLFDRTNLLATMRLLTD